MLGCFINQKGRVCWDKSHLTSAHVFWDWNSRLWGNNFAGFLLTENEGWFFFFAFPLISIPEIFCELIFYFLWSEFFSYLIHTKHCIEKWQRLGQRTKELCTSHLGSISNDRVKIEVHESLHYLTLPLSISFLRMPWNMKTSFNALWELLWERWSKGLCWLGCPLSPRKVMHSIWRWWNAWLTLPQRMINIFLKHLLPDYPSFH